LFAAGAVLAAGVALLVRGTQVRARAALDPVRAALLGAGLVSLVLAISKGPARGWSSGAIVALFAASALLLSLSALAEPRVRQPIVDLALVATRPFVNTNICAFGFGFAFFVAVFVIPQIAASPDASGYGLGLSVTKIGLLLVPTSAAGLAGGWLGGRIVDVVGPRALVAAGTLVGVYCIVSHAIHAHDTAR